MKNSLAEVKLALEKELQTNSESNSSSTNSMKREIEIDNDIPNLLILPPQFDLHTHPLYEDGSIILQDKASCFSAFVLFPPKNSVVLDACSAPGNKTSHISSLMENTGKIFAFEKDSNRFKTLNKMIEKAGCKNIKTFHQDFLETEPNNPKSELFPVEYILVDPSCSGSGIINRIEKFTSGFFKKTLHCN